MRRLAPRLLPHARPMARDRRERGNIVLIAALLVLAMGTSGMVIARLITTRLNLDAEYRLSNYGPTLAKYVAESGVNSLLYYWNTRQIAAPNRPAAYPPFPDVTATYSIPGGGTAVPVTSTATYSVNIQTVQAETPGVPGIYTVVSDATVSSLAASPQWRTINRRIRVTIASTSVPNRPYWVTEYRR